MGKKSKRREKQGGVSSGAAPAVVLDKCHHCGLKPEEVEKLGLHCAGLSICSGCRLACFCSTACQKAAWPGHRDTCKAAKAEARANVGSIWEAAKYGHTKKLSKLLASYPAAVNLRMEQDMGSGLPLEIAAAEGRYEAVKVLLDAGARVDIGDFTFGQLPIHRAAESGCVKTARILLERGSEVVVGDRMGQHPLHFAAEYGRFEMIQFLLENGAKDSLTIPYRGKTPKMWALMMGHDKCAELL